MAVHDLLGLPRPEFPLDQDRIEEAREPVALDLVTLLAGVAVGDQAQRHALLPEVLQRVERVGEQPHHLAPARGEVTGDGRREAVRCRAAQTLQRELHDVLPGAEHVDALLAMALGIVPEPPPGFGERAQEYRGIDAGTRAARVARSGPASVDAAGVVEQRVVEVEQQRGDRRGVHGSAAITPRIVSTARSMSGKSMLGSSSPEVATIVGSSGKWTKPTAGRRGQPLTVWSVQ